MGKVVCVCRSGTVCDLACKCSGRVVFIVVGCKCSGCKLACVCSERVVLCLLWWDVSVVGANVLVVEGL